MTFQLLSDKLKVNKANYSQSMRMVKATKKRIQDYKELHVYDGRDRDVYESRLRRYKSDVEFYRTLCLGIADKLNLYKAITGGTIQAPLVGDKPITKMPLSVGHDYRDANEILESGEITSSYDAETYWNYRPDNDFVGTYALSIERLDDYYNFISVLIDDILVLGRNILDFSLSYDEWKTGFKVEGKRQSRLNKFLRKKGFSQYTLDFYSQQVKTETEIFLTVSDRVQHIAGMSYYSTMEWDGMNGSSCQDPRNEYEECNRLLASMHDNKAFIAFIHHDLDDLEDMEEKMLARSMCRYITVDEKTVLISTRLYGNNETRNLLEKALIQLNDYGIYTMGQMDSGNSVTHEERTNGQCTITEYDEVHIREDYEDHVTCNCPACGGDGTLNVYASSGNSVEIECPACNGRGEIETYVSVYVDEYIDVEDETELTPYDEEYNHYGYKISISINRTILGLDK